MRVRSLKVLPPGTLVGNTKPTGFKPWPLGIGLALPVWTQATPCSLTGQALWMCTSQFTFPFQMSLILVTAATTNSYPMSQTTCLFVPPPPLCNNHTHDLLRETFVNRTHHHYSRQSGASQTWEQCLNLNHPKRKLPSLSELHFPLLCNRIAKVIMKIKFCPLTFYEVDLPFIKVSV